MNDIVTIISTVGFPIVSFLISVWFIKYMYDSNLTQHKEDMGKVTALTEAVNNNTVAIVKLADSIEKGENDGK